MITNLRFVAFDLGSSQITAIAAEVLESGEIRVVSSETKLSDDIKFGVVEQHTGAAFKVNELQKRLQNSSRIYDISMVSSSLNAKSMRLRTERISRFVPKPNVITDELLLEMQDECERMINADDELQVLDIFPVSYFVDGMRLDEPVGRTGSQISAQYHVVIANKYVKSQRDRCFEKTGLMLEYSPLGIEALSTVLLEEEERVCGCAIIDFGAETTTMGVYHDDVLQLLIVVPLGSKHITKDIEELGISYQHAERLKCLTGVAMESLVNEPIYVQIPSIHENTPAVKISTQFLARIIEARLEETFQPIFDVLDQLNFELERGIVICGGGSKLSGLTSFIQHHTGFESRFGSHVDWLSNDTDEKYHDTLFSKLVGTIILTNEYRKEHPIEITIIDPERGPKLPKKKLGEKIANRVLSFFEEDSSMRDNK